MSEEKLPKGWKWKPLKELNSRKSKNLDPSKFPDTTFELYSVTQFEYSEPEYLKGSEIKSTKQKVDLGDVLISKINPRINRVWVVKDFSNYEKIASSEWIIVKPKSFINSKYIKYATTAPFFRTLLQSEVSGVGGSLTRARPKIVENYKIPIAPLPEQERIVDRLDAIFGHLDVLKEKLDRIPVLLKNFRQQVLTRAVTGQLTKEWRKENLATVDSAIEEGKELISEKKILYRNQTANFLEKLEKSLSLELNGIFFSDDWCTIKPEFISSPEKYSIGIGPFGSNLKVSDYKTEGYPLIFVRNVIANQFTGLDPKFVDKEKFQELLAHSIEPGDLLITKMGTPPGDCKLYPESSREGIITSDILKVRIWKKYFVPKFYEYVISSKIVKTQIEAITKGVAHQKISLKRFKEIELPFPTKREQEEIVNKVDALFGLSNKIESQYQSLKAKIDQMPQAILAKAFCGELVEQEVKEYVREVEEIMMAAEGKIDYSNTTTKAGS